MVLKLSSHNLDGRGADPVVILANAAKIPVRLFKEKIREGDILWNFEPYPLDQRQNVRRLRDHHVWSVTVQPVSKWNWIRQH